MMRYLLLFAALLLLQSCSQKRSSNGSDISNGYNSLQDNMFPMVKLPPSLAADRRLAANYMVLHFWDSFLSEERLLKLAPNEQPAQQTNALAQQQSPDNETVLGLSKDIFADAFTKYAIMLEAAEDSVANRSITALMERAEQIARYGAPELLGSIIECAESTLYNAYSPLVDEQLYIPVLEAIERSAVVPGNVKDSYRPQYEISLKNSRGTVAADFTYTTLSGSKRRMHNIKSEYLLIYFNNPDCLTCQQTLQAMKEADIITSLVRHKRLAVLAICPDVTSSNIQLWREKSSEIPPQWIYGCQTTGELMAGTIYSLRAIPSIYLLDAQKRVLLKDADLIRTLSKLNSLEFSA